ncbi:hypothetical protein HDE_13146 [Halotydeus destructor]|nr:hypothetical protein HDE_13146 [Halotydeus destructor]
MSAKKPDEKLDELKQQLVHALMNKDADEEAWMKIIDSMSNNQVRILKNEVKAELRRRRKNGGVNAQRYTNLLGDTSSCSSKQASSS